MEARKDITLDQALVLQQRMESAEEIIPLIRKWGGSVSLGNTSLRCSVTGTTAAYGNTSAGTTLAGRFFNDIEERSADNVVVIGFNINKNLFPSQSAIGQSIKIAGIPYRIVGVIEKRGFLFMDFVDNEVFIPLHAFRGAYGFVGRSFSVGIKAGSERLLDIVRDEATGHMRSIRNTPPGDESDFSINEMKAFDQQAKNIRVGIWVVGMGLTLLAFIVGSIGIMNIMYVSVTERTKEIGVRKAIGARRSSILLQFLIESALLCLTGAVIAFPIAQLLVGSARFLAVSVFEMDWASVVSPIIPLDLLGIAVGVSIVVGLLAGLLPALKASGLDPVEALRSE
jgi:putative ABC transport system permease protein